MRHACLLLGLLLVTFLPARAGHSAPKIFFRIHVQTTGAGLSPQEAMNIQLPPNGEPIQIRTFPEVTEDNVIGVAQDTAGLHLQFDHTGTVNLNAVTAQNQGRIMVVLIDNTIFYAPVIDTQISNGRLDIPHHLTPQALALLQGKAQQNVRQDAKS
jgi:hypothetical protein